jgi:NTP pyrophosphatase (non-canonical NTP hydrolase)
MTEPCADCPEFDPATVDYQTGARRTANLGVDPADFNAKDLRVLNFALGLAGEVGELVDAIKKWAFHGHTISESYVRKELGDIGWYRANLASEFDLLLEDIDRCNLYKLRERYPEGFSTERSINRPS